MLFVKIVPSVGREWGRGEGEGREERDLLFMLHFLPEVVQWIIEKKGKKAIVSRAVGGSGHNGDKSCFRNEKRENTTQGSPVAYS